MSFETQLYIYIYIYVYNNQIIIMVALQVKQICMYLELASRFTKNHQYKLGQGEDRLTQTLVFPKFSYIYRNTWCLNLL